MKKNTRIVIETDSRKKEVLKSILKEYDTSLTDWFISKVEEELPILRQDKSDKTNGIEDFNLDKTSIINKLESIDWAFTNEHTQYLSHNLHPYPAKFIPQLPHYLIRILSTRGEKVYDPFGGSGTTALEAIILGRQAYSSDVNPISKIIGEAKTLTLTKEDEEQLILFNEKIELLYSNLENLEDVYKRYGEDIKKLIPNIPNIGKWFHQNVINELGIIKWNIQQIESGQSKTLAKAVFSKIILRASNQDSETRYVSKPQEVKDGQVLKIYNSELSKAIIKVKKLGSIKRFSGAKFFISDLRIEKPLPDNSVDLIVTSPPYPNATDYHLYHRFRIFWLDGDPISLGKKEIGSHLRHQKEKTGIDFYLKEMKASMQSMFDVLRPGRYAAIVIGSSKFKGKDYDTPHLLAETAKSLGFELVSIIERKLPDNKRSFVSAARRLRTEKIVIIQKPLPKINKLKLESPSYKLWSYEEELSKLEKKSLFPHENIGNRKNNSIIPFNADYIDNLKKLTFTSSFGGKYFSQESTWQKILESSNKTLNGTRKNSKYVTHGIHSYKGKFYPQIAKSLFNIANLQRGQTVFDPFCGSGTVLLEAYLNGIKGIGMDMNPIAVKIAKTKTSILQINPCLFENITAKFLSQIAKISNPKNADAYFAEDIRTELYSWFPELVVHKLAEVLKIIDGIPVVVIRDFLEVMVSSIVRKISQQDPRDLRIRRRSEPLNDAPVIELLTEQVIKYRKNILEFAKYANCSPYPFYQSKAYHLDNRIIESYTHSNFSQKTIDAVITSPPYATALPYIDTDRLSLMLLFRLRSKERSQLEKDITGSREITVANRSKIDTLIEEGDFNGISSKSAIETVNEVYSLNKNAKVGFRKKNKAALLYRYFSHMEMVMTRVDEVLSKGKPAFFVIGNNKTKAGDKDISIFSNKILAEIGESLGWKKILSIPISVTLENYKHAKNSISENDIIWFEK